MFWEKAMSGHTFYTGPSDHYNCAVGSYTHSIALPAERAHELNDTMFSWLKRTTLYLRKCRVFPR